VVRALITAKVNLGDFKGAKEWITKLKEVDQSQAPAFEAWGAVLSKIANETLLADAETTTGTPGVDPRAKAAVQLALGRTDDARDSLRLAIKDDEFDEVDARVWVLYGLVARDYGLPDEAAALWQRARKAKNQDDTAEWSLALIPR
jgi:tetratricopeptide (TPR) repeat protein